MRFALGLLLLTSLQLVHAAQVDITLDTGTLANADYRPGKPDKPAVMVVHGFLSTFNYGTVQAMADDLAGKGYTLLTPNLTFGVSARREPLPCDTPHTHTVAEEGAELAAWARWLKSKGHRDLFMIGHSAGSTSILASLEQSIPTLRGIILTAVYDFDNFSPEVMEKDRKTALSQQQGNGLSGYFLGFCQGNFRATGRSYLSYRHWNRTRIIDAINRSPVTVSAIMPGNDRRLEGRNANWLDELRASKARLSVVPGADHFFSALHEFDLNEQVAASLP